MGGHFLLLGGGFIGQALARRLTELGKKVMVVARNAPPHALPGVIWRKSDLSDAALLGDVLPDCHAVIHLATTSTPGTYSREPLREAEENLRPLLQLMHALDSYPTIPLVYLSSGGVIYGNPETLPVTEEHGLVPLSYHAAGKAAAEHFLGVFARQGHRVIILRPSNAYGPGQPFKTGFGVIPTLLEHLLRGTPMEIWGDGETVRDYLYIDDLVEACLKALHHPASGTFNVGSGEGHSLNELCRLAERVTSRQLELHYRPARGGDVKAVVLDVDRIRREMGWVPQVDLEEGLRRTWTKLLDEA
ncbi:NAD-dependent epimerase/dehydratase [Sulfuricella denitrificans skB26]|uniref:NAD-dependent epimerase/dehydratase n=1 Tax=Sulfuricella denitrificans (strain DSM 22764 / NBRC 105220 / skB26) TaxID=1163617 RepID=S6AAS5_SULDS|nr:NAD-dependent epimerase/dehydratase family protein [Sulfuricella denitrificans]BAN36200.1 NAD-dependent epimerase/dehydratase [Sulfuricella denitrificans skB26]